MLLLCGADGEIYARKDDIFCHVAGMRAARLLQILLLLQNRGRMTSRALAEELEVAPRTILRDLDAMTEAGLPVVAHQGHGGGIELSFNYRSRLTGLAADEAEALAYLLARPAPELAAVGLDRAGARAAAKLVESFPDTVRARMARARRWYRAAEPAPLHEDLRVAAIAGAVRAGTLVRLQSRSRRPRAVRPEARVWDGQGWALIDGWAPEHPIPAAAWGDINISALPAGERPPD
ncbi:MAG: HTH domain-containing protein [Pseudomonadota bacterium]